MLKHKLKTVQCHCRLCHYNLYPTVCSIIIIILLLLLLLFLSLLQQGTTQKFTYRKETAGGGNSRGICPGKYPTFKHVTSFNRWFQRI